MTDEDTGRGGLHTAVGDRRLDLRHDLVVEKAMRYQQPCAKHGCPRLVERGYCSDHDREKDREIKKRATWRWVYSDPRWRGLRRQVRREQLLCATPGCKEWWRELDHIVPLQDGGEPFDRANVQGLCRPCHSRKTAQEINGRKART